MNGEIIIYQNPDGNIKIDVRLEEETVWLTQAQMGQLFGKDKRTISEHIGNIFKEGELDENVVVRKFRTTIQHGAIAGKTQEVEVNGYNLDVIISVGYRVKSPQGTQFRIWATLQAHPAIEKQSAANQATNRALELLEAYVHDRVKEMLANLGEYIRRAALFEHKGLSNQSYNREKASL
ncbi:virulence RhuM family protein [Parapedobacter tibetensis]|uniref:virulence RhuM family protein n=1 Tax=Parapedobacter tibetensis TaxID=2972951 RepID=UPI00214D5921|nr:RhuM family protein [Parapedobacter tibetensis]